MQSREHAASSDRQADIGSPAKPLTIADWVYLNVGDEVVVQRLGELPHAGEVDDVNDDATIFWVCLHNGRGRILVSARDGSLVMRNWR